MTKLENTFFEEYKKMDALCGKRLGVKNGVSAYIDELSEQPRSRSRADSRDEELKTLKHLRWVRNQLAHESGVEKLVTGEDLERLRAFTQRLETGTDPLSRLRGPTKGAAASSRAPSSAKKSPAAKTAAAKPSASAKKRASSGKRPAKKKRRASFRYRALLLSALCLLLLLLLLWGADRAFPGAPALVRAFFTERIPGAWARLLARLQKP